jgi:hypothetical protein
MLELSEPAPTMGEQLIADAEKRLAERSRSALEFIHGTQQLMFDEAMLAGNDALDRARTEMHLFSELISKLAGAHSVANLQTMYEECSRHQIDFLRRDSERLFRHGQRVIETTAKLMANLRRS